MRRWLSFLLALAMVFACAGFAAAEDLDLPEDDEGYTGGDDWDDDDWDDDWDDDPPEIPEGAVAFGGAWYYRLLEDGTAEIALYAGEEEHVVIPPEVDGIPVTSVGERAFEENSWIGSVVIPEGVTRVGKYAFGDCGHLETVEIPGTVEVLGDSAFIRCHRLRSVVIPEGVTELGSHLFFDTYFTEIALPDSLRVIGDHAFQCSSLESVVIPEGVTWIGGYAFSSCLKLTSVTIPDSVIHVGDSPFSGSVPLEVRFSDPHPYLEIKDGALFSKPDSRLIEILEAPEGGACTVPEGTKVIGRGAFSGTRFTSVVIPDSVEEMGDYVFYTCVSLKSVLIPDSVKSVGEGVFAGCSSLEEVRLPAGTGPARMMFDGCRSLVSVEIPEGAEKIGGYAFRDCKKLASVTIPATVTSIGERAFSGCASLETLMIPESVTGFGNDPFYGCKKLTVTVKPDSAAEQYCIDFNLPYEAAE